MDSLGGDIFALKITLLNSTSDTREVHGLALLFEDNEDFIANILGVYRWPFDQTPVAL